MTSGGPFQPELFYDSSYPLFSPKLAVTVSIPDKSCQCNKKVDSFKDSLLNGQESTVKNKYAGHKSMLASKKCKSRD